MAIMKMDVNFVFFILIIATVVGFAGFTAYYQVSFRNINEEYNTKLAELNQVTKDLLEKKVALTQTTIELNTTKKGRKELGERYEDLKDERDYLRNERDALQENLFQTRSELSAKTSQLEVVNAQLLVVKQQADNYKSDRDYYKQKYEECKASLSNQ